MIVLLILFIIIHVLLLHLGTQIGEKGRRNVFLQNVLFIAEAVLFLVFSLMWGTFSAKDSKIYALGVAVIGIVLLISGIIGGTGILREASDELITEHLSDIRVTRAGYHNQARKLEGISNGRRSWFIMRGADKALAEQIKNSGRKQVTVIYHPSNRRIESIQV
jgi:hypothetical protein